jgi:hypothetical protein
MPDPVGKRSACQFERRDRDAYPTPLVAALPLIPWLRGIRTFAEPCAGNGDLIHHLESHGLRCVYAADIATEQELIQDLAEHGLSRLYAGPIIAGQDALAHTSYGNVDVIITNLPWAKRPRTLLHRLISHFQAIAPSWLLFDLDWAHTKQAVPYLRSCTDILPIGRVIWFPGTNMHGFDNTAWYRFDARHTAGPVFHALRSAPPRTEGRAAVCAQCGKPYLRQRSDSRTCSGACRQRLRRERLKRDTTVTAPKCDTAVTISTPEREAIP